MVDIDSDADTLDPDALAVLEVFKPQMEAIAETMDSLRLIAAAWLVGIEEHKYTVKLREDISHFVAEATMQWTLVLSVIEGPGTTDASYATQQLETSSVVATNLTEEFLGLKQIASNFMPAAICEGEFDHTANSEDGSGNVDGSSSEPKRRRG